MTESTEPSAVSDFERLPHVSSFRWTSSTDGAVLSVGAQDLLGVSSPITMDGFFSHVHPDDRVRFEAETIAHLQDGGEITREVRFIRPDGELKHLIVTSSLIRSTITEHDVVDGIFIDVTKARLQADPRDQEKSRTLGSYDFDIKSGVSVWSPTLRQVFGNTSSVPVTLDEVHLAVHPEDREWVIARMQEAMRAPGQYDFRFRIVLPDETVMTVRDIGEAHPLPDTSNGRVGRITGILIDVSAESDRSADRSLDNAAFWQLIDAAPIGAYAVDADLRMVRVSKTAKAAFAEIDNLIGRDLAEVLHILWNDPFASEAVSQFRNTLETGVSYHADPVIEERADRKILEAYDWSIERIELDNGQPGVLCYFYDLSARVRDERVMEEQKRRLGLAYSAAKMGAWEVDLQTGEASGSPQLYQLFGEPDYDGSLRDLWDRSIHPDDRGSVDKAFAASIAENTSFDIDFRIFGKDGNTRHLAARGEVLYDNKGAPTKFIGVNQDISERKKVEIALRQSEDQMRTVINHTLAFVGVLDSEGSMVEVNQPALDFGGLTKEDVVGKPFWETFWWTHEDTVSENCRSAVQEAKAGRTQRFDVVVRGKDGAFITIDFLLEPVLDEAGDLQMLVASGFDISAREEARARERMLMGEINHRTKNILTLVQAVARQTARGGTEGFLSRFEDRLSALAKAQDLLFQSATDQVDLRSLAQSQLAHFLDTMETRISLDGPDINLSAQVAQTIGMALHELATNAGKYGALSSDVGRVDISWRVIPEDKTFEITWTEHDGPSVTPPVSKGFGSTVINQMTRSVLNAEVQMDFEPQGVQWRLFCDSAKLMSNR